MQLDIKMKVYGNNLSVNKFDKNIRQHIKKRLAEDMALLCKEVYFNYGVSYTYNKPYIFIKIRKLNNTYFMSHDYENIYWLLKDGQFKWRKQQELSINVNGHIVQLDIKLELERLEPGLFSSKGHKKILADK